MLPDPVVSSLGAFGDDVLDLYRRGVAETELPASELVARSLMPPDRPPVATSAPWRPRFPS